MGLFEKLRNLKPEIKDVNQPGGSLDPSFHGTKTELPVKWIGNTRQNLDLQRLYTHGPLKYENTGRTCGNCVNFYYDPASKYGGRCRARGFMEVHEDTPADETNDFTHPVDGYWFPLWPACPLFQIKDRLSKK